MKYTLSLTFLASLVLFPTLALAGPIVRGGETVSVGADQILDSDFYGFGYGLWSTVTISGEAKEDEYLVGGSITVNAPVEKDLVALGTTVQIHAPVLDDVRIVGGQTVIASSVGGDVVVFGGELKILSTAEVKGDILFFGGLLDVSGPVKGSVFGRGESIRIDANVMGDVDVTASKSLELGDGAHIEGTLTYKSAFDLVRAQEAVIVGDIMKEAWYEEVATSPYAVLLPIAILLFVSLTLFMFFKNHIQNLTDTISVSYGVLGLIGLGVFLGLPFIAMVLLVSIIGAVVGFMLLLFYILLLIATWAMAGTILGTLALGPLTHSKSVTLLTALVGTLVFMFVSFIPFIGPLLFIVGFLIVLGALSKQTYQLFR